MEKLKEGIADKLAVFSYLVCSFIACVLFAFLYGWKLTLVVLSCAPLIIISTAFVAKMQSSLTAQEMVSYGNAGTIAEEVLSSIRTVVAFGGEKKEVDRYKSHLAPTERTGHLKGIYSGLGGGSMWLFIYCCYALAFWYGLELILEDRDKIDKQYTPAVLVVVLFGVLIGAQNLGFTSPHLESFAAARASAKAIFEIIDRRPIIDAMGTGGVKPKTMVGNIEFRDVYFDYPARSNVKVLQGLNLVVPAGQTVALVGPSGCGKSTCLQLVQRLYDPLKVSIDFLVTFVSELKIELMKPLFRELFMWMAIKSVTLIRFGCVHLSALSVRNPFFSLRQLVWIVYSWICILRSILK